MVGRPIISKIAKNINLNYLLNKVNHRQLFPFYHTVSNISLPHIRNLYQAKNTKQFTEDLEWLCKHFEPVCLESIIKNQKSKKPIFHLSFDDGLKEIYTVINPILIKKGIPASIFINTDFIDDKNIFFRYKISIIIDEVKSHKEKSTLLSKNLNLPNKSNHVINKLLSLKYRDTLQIDSLAKCIGIEFNEYLDRNRIYLSKSELLELKEQGTNIGSHSMDHPLFSDLNFSEQQIQIDNSFRYLNDEIGIRSKYFSFPFNDHKISSRFFEYLNENHCKASFGISGLKFDSAKNHFHRIPMEQGQYTAKEIIHSEFFYFILKSYFGKNKINRN